MPCCGWEAKCLHHKKIFRKKKFVILYNSAKRVGKHWCLKSKYIKDCHEYFALKKQIQINFDDSIKNKIFDLYLEISEVASLRFKMN